MSQVTISIAGILDDVDAISSLETSSIKKFAVYCCRSRFTINPCNIRRHVFTDDILDSFAIRPLNISAIYDDVTGIEPADVIGEIAVQVFNPPLGIGHMEGYDFAEHAEETFVFTADGQVYCVDFASVNDAEANLPLGPDDIEIVNLSAGILPAAAIANDATWRPDGSGVALGAVLNPGTTVSEQVIAEIVFDWPNPYGCPDTPTAQNSTFNVIAGGGTDKRPPRLFHPDYRSNTP